MRRTLALIVAALLTSAAAGAQGLPRFERIPAPEEPDAIPLYAGVAPGSEQATQLEVWETAPGPNARVVRNVTRPTLTPFLPAAGSATGAAMIVAPGGAFMMLAIDSEGYQVAQWMADHGVAAFVLKYRLEKTSPDVETFLKELMAKVGAVAAPGAPPPETPAEALADAKAALNLVRTRATEWGVDPGRVGLMGFSAGAMTTLSMGLLAEPAARPDFIALIYGPMGHREVPADAPPMFAAIAADDPIFRGGHPELFTAWLAAKRPAELHVFEQGGHGFGMRTQDTTSDHWIDELHWWMKARGYLGTR